MLSLGSPVSFPRGIGLPFRFLRCSERSSFQTTSLGIPRGKNPLTRTTTLTLPAPWSAVFWPISTSSESLDRKEGVDADDLRGRKREAAPGKARESSAILWRASRICLMSVVKRCRRSACVQKMDVTM